MPKELPRSDFYPDLRRIHFEKERGGRGGRREDDFLFVWLRQVADLYFDPVGIKEL